MHVTPSPVDDRSFESSVALTPEQVAANTEHFAGKGLEYSVRNLDGEGNPVPDEAKPADTAVTDKPVDKAAEGEVDAEAKAEFAEMQQAKTDGERLGHHAKRTKKIKELSQEVESSKAALSTKDALLAEKDKEIERLLKVGVSTPASAPSPFSPPAQAAPAAAPVAAPAKQDPIEEEIKAKAFEKPAPAEPIWQEILDKDTTGDPYKAYAEAGIKYNRELLQYELDKREHDRTQSTEVERAKQQKSQQREQQQQAVQAEQGKFAEIAKVHPDFDSVTAAVKYTPILVYLLKDRISDGLELGYQLAKPENAELYKDLVEKTADKSRSSDETMRLLDDVMLDLGAFRKDLKKSVAGQTPVAKPAEAAPPIGTTAPQQSSSIQSPRIEEAAAPIPVRGKANGAPKGLEDIDPEDSDARRAFKKAQGLMK